MSIATDLQSLLGPAVLLRCRSGQIGRRCEVSARKKALRWSRASASTRRLVEKILATPIRKRDRRPVFIPIEDESEL